MRPGIVLPLVAAAATALAAAAFALAAGPTTGHTTSGNAVKGKALFLRAGVFCGSCHTFKAAASNGRDGPDLDRSKLSYAGVVQAITKGGKASKQWPTGMPHYGGFGAVFTKAQIADVAAFVFTRRT